MANLATTEEIDDQVDDESPEDEEESAPQETQAEENPFRVIGEMARKDARYAQAIRTIAGRDPDYRKALSERDELKAKLADLEAEHVASRYRTMDQAELAEKLRDDPNFRAQYARDTAPRESTTITPEIQRFRDTVLDTIDDLVISGAPEQWKNDVLGYVREGQFGTVEKDGTAGVVRRLTSYVEGLKHRRPWEEQQHQQQPKAEAEEGEQEAPPRTPNPRLSENADMRPSSSPNGRRNARPRYATVNEAAALFNEDKISRKEYEDAKRTLPFE